MQSPREEKSSAEVRFRKAFERLKANTPNVLETGTPITQNNVAREAACDPSALKKSRFPALIREIQAFIELHKNCDHSSSQKSKRKRAAKRSIQERLDDAVRQRNFSQSVLASANLRILELSEEVQLLTRQLDELRPPPTQLLA